MGRYVDRQTDRKEGVGRQGYLLQGIALLDCGGWLSKSQIHQAGNEDDCGKAGMLVTGGSGSTGNNFFSICDTSPVLLKFVQLIQLSPSRRSRIISLTQSHLVRGLHSSP